jgi:Ca2+-binding EF-hand superfamily protein
MRAMGYYPTKQEEKNMIDEVRFSVLAEKGQPTTHVKLDDFIKLFVNHRPVYGIGQNNIEDAFNALCQSENASMLRREALLRMLKSECEEIKDGEMKEILSLLTGQSEEDKALLEEI